MAWISAQVSLYPLRQSHLSPLIDEAVQLFKDRRLVVEPGSMSTTLAGEENDLFRAVAEVFHRGAETGELVMVLTVSNACPVCKPDDGKTGIETD